MACQKLHRNTKFLTNPVATNTSSVVGHQSELRSNTKSWARWPDSKDFEGYGWLNWGTRKLANLSSKLALGIENHLNEPTFTSSGQPTVDQGLFQDERRWTTIMVSHWMISQPCFKRYRFFWKYSMYSNSSGYHKFPYVSTLKCNFWGIPHSQTSVCGSVCLCVWRYGDSIVIVWVEMIRIEQVGWHHVAMFF